MPAKSEKKKIYLSQNSQQRNFKIFLWKRQNSDTLFHWAIQTGYCNLIKKLGNVYEQKSNKRRNI